jgi:hypothetical protein
MKNKSLFPPKLNAVNESMNSLYDFIKNSYNEQKEKITEGVSFLKDGISDVIDKTRSYVNIFAFPINNFLKDFTQIEEEFKQETTKTEQYCICLEGEMVTESEVLARPMEENY